MTTQFQTESKPKSQALDSPVANPAVKHHYSGQRGFSAEKPSCQIQAKLKMGQPGDKYEQEADRMADQFMTISDPKLQLKPG